MPHDPEFVIRVWGCLLARYQGLMPSTLESRAWEHFYSIYSHLIGEVVRCFHLQPGDVENVVQETWAAFVKRPPALHGNGLEDEAQLRAWFSRAGSRKAMDLLRKRKHHGTQDIEKVLGTLDEPSTPAEAPDELLDREWTRDLVRDVLDDVRVQCGEDAFRMVQMHYMEGLPVKVIADALGTTPGAVRAKLGRLREKVRKALLRRQADSEDRTAN